MKKMILVTIALFGLTIAVFVFLFYRGILRLNYPSNEEYPVQGIDISHHQGDIDWKDLSQENISFVFIKATEGADFKDPNFKVNLMNAKTTKLAVGAYHFYRLCKNGTEQADNFISTVSKNDISLPPVIDLEFGGNCKTDKSEGQILKEVQEFINKVTEHYGRTPILYVTTEFYEKYMQKRFTDCPIWIRDIYGKPQLPDNRKWTFWQYANRGHLNGIEGFVDINVFNGDKTSFERYISFDKKIRE